MRRSLARLTLTTVVTSKRSLLSERGQHAADTTRQLHARPRGMQPLSSPLAAKPVSSSPALHKEANFSSLLGVSSLSKILSWKHAEPQHCDAGWQGM